MAAMKIFTKENLVSFPVKAITHLLIKINLFFVKANKTSYKLRPLVEILTSGHRSKKIFDKLKSAHDSIMSRHSLKYL